LEYVHTKLDNEVNKVTTVHTDSMTLESLNNMYKHTFLTEEIRQKVQEMGSRGWTTWFRWTKAHVGTTGNELADKLAKEASSKIEIPISYNRVPKSVIKRDLEDNSRETWQKEWETTNKGTTTKQYLPTVLERLKMKIILTQKLMNLVTGNGNTKSHLHRFRTIETPDCPCGNGNQTAEHILLECGILREERERLIAAVAKTDNWPIKKICLSKNTTKHSQNSRKRWTK